MEYESLFIYLEDVHNHALISKINQKVFLGNV